MARHWLADHTDNLTLSRRQAWGKAGEQRGSANPGFQRKKLKTQNHSLWKISVGIVAAGETPSIIGHYIGETHKVQKHAQTHPPTNQYLKGTNRLWEARKVRESVRKAELAALFLL